MNTRSFLSGLLLAGSLMVAACGTTDNRIAPADSARSGYGVVESVQLMNRDDPSLLGTVAGGLVGGVLGHQVGSGRGQTAATIAGAVGGAYAGNQIEKRSTSQHAVYKITVRMNDGSYLTTTQETDAGISTGDRVYVRDGIVQRD